MPSPPGWAAAREGEVVFKLLAEAGSGVTWGPARLPQPGLRWLCVPQSLGVPAAPGVGGWPPRGVHPTSLPGRPGRAVRHPHGTSLTLQTQ